MSVRRSAGTIFWGLTLVTVGALLLARNMGYSLPVWTYVARYWPALLIAWGMLKFFDYYRFRSAGDTRPLFSGGEVGLLIIVIIACSAVTTALLWQRCADGYSGWFGVVRSGTHEASASVKGLPSRSAWGIAW